MTGTTEPADSGAEPGDEAATRPESRFVWVLRCPCGTALEGATEDEIVETSVAHLREAHPDLVDVYERDHILFMAQRFVRT
jgi:hypothetical protein